MMNSALYINLFSAAVGVIMGILLLSGLMFQNMDFNTRLVFGFIFLGYGIYRYLNVRTKMKLHKRQMESDKLKKAQEDLIRTNTKI